MARLPAPPADAQASIDAAAAAADILYDRDLNDEEAFDAFMNAPVGTEISSSQAAKFAALSKVAEVEADADEEEEEEPVFEEEEDEAPTEPIAPPKAFTEAQAARLEAEVRLDFGLPPLPAQLPAPQPVFPLPPMAGRGKGKGNPFGFGFGAGKGGKGYGMGKGGKGAAYGAAGILQASQAKRHRYRKDHGSAPPISKQAIRRLARRGGVRRMSALVYDEARAALRCMLKNVIHDAVIYTEYARRNTVTVMDVVHALKHQGIPLYGFGNK